MSSGMISVNLLCSFEWAICPCFFVHLVIFVENWILEYYNATTLEIRYSSFLRICCFLVWIVEGYSSLSVKQIFSVLFCIDCILCYALSLKSLILSLCRTRVLTEISLNVRSEKHTNKPTFLSFWKMTLCLGFPSTLSQIWTELKDQANMKA